MILNTFATKLGMTQAWTKKGQRLAVTRVSLDEMAVIGKQEVPVLDKTSQLKETLPCTILEIGHGEKKLKHMKKPLRSKIEKGGFSFGYKNLLSKNCFLFFLEKIFKPISTIFYCSFLSF